MSSPPPTRKSSPVPDQLVLSGSPTAPTEEAPDVPVLEAPREPDPEAPREPDPEASPPLAPTHAPPAPPSSAPGSAPLPPEKEPQAERFQAVGNAQMLEADAAAMAGVTAEGKRRVRERRRSDAGMSRHESIREARRAALNGSGFVAEDELAMRLTGGTRSMLREECKSFWKEKRLETLVACHVKFTALTGGGRRLQLPQLKEVCPP